jgi:hypothetical protein
MDPLLRPSLKRMLIRTPHSTVAIVKKLDPWRLAEVFNL